MRRISALTAAVVLLGVFALVGPVQAQESPVIGAWITSSWDGQDGDPQPGLVIFTEANYSIMFVPPGMVREAWVNEPPNQAEALAAVSTLIANSGRYTWSGDEITTEAYVALSPNYMAEWGENHATYTFRVEGETLHLTWPEAFGGTEGRLAGTFRKVG